MPSAAPGSGIYSGEIHTLISQKETVRGFDCPARHFLSCRVLTRDTKIGLEKLELNPLLDRRGCFTILGFRWSPLMVRSLVRHKKEMRMMERRIRWVQNNSGLSPPGCLFWFRWSRISWGWGDQCVQSVFACVCVCVLKRSGLVIRRRLRQSCQIFDRFFLCSVGGA